MIYRNRSDFLKALTEFVKRSLQDPASHKSTATFEVGDLLKGFGLTVTNAGWISTLEGVTTNGHKHIASPLANLQAAYVALHD